MIPIQESRVQAIHYYG